MKSYSHTINTFKMPIVMALLFISSLTYAGKEPELRSYKQCSVLKTGDTLLVYDQLFLNGAGFGTGTSPSGYHLFNTTNLLTLEVDQNSVVDCNLPQFTMQVVVKVDRLNESGAAIGSSQTITLNITYDKTLIEKYKEKHTFTFQGGFWYKAEIVSMTPSNVAAKPFVKLSIGTRIERYKNINKAGIPFFKFA